MRGVPESADTQPLEQHRAFFAEGVLAIVERFLHPDWPGLAHGDGGIGRIPRDPERAFDPARLRLADENGDPSIFESS